MKYKILVADDEVFNREIIKGVLVEEDTDYEIIEAEDGFSVLQTIRDNEPDLLLLDIGMPKKSGLEVLEEIRNDSHLDALPVIVITAYPEEKYNALEMGANDFIAKPIEVVDLKLRVKNSLKLKSYSNMLLNFNHELDRQVKERTRDLKKALDKSKAAELEVVLKLGKAAEFRDLETGVHLFRIRNFTKLLAQKLGLDDNDVDLIYNASPLHDVGKVGIPDRVLLKPGRLDKNEFEIIKKHVEIGMEILSDHQDYPLLKAAYYITRDHHENWDGTGYPFGRKETDIHVFGRICKIVDVFDALTSKRVYKDAYSIDKALNIMEKDIGKMFDPDIYSIFLENIDEFKVIKEESEEREEELPPILKIMQTIER
jgi:putative two-component system response regulator